MLTLEEVTYFKLSNNYEWKEKLISQVARWSKINKTVPSFIFYYISLTVYNAANTGKNLQHMNS